MNPLSDPMHPAPEHWAEYLYDEASPETRARLEAHLRDCPVCRHQLARWQGVHAALDAWELPTPRPAPARTTPRAALRLAVAALLILGLGWWGGRLAAPSAPDLGALRTAIAEELRPTLEREFQARLDAALQAADQRLAERVHALAAAWTAARLEDQQATLALYQRAERQRLSDYATLRRDLETVAIVGQGALGLTQQQLSQLAVYTAAPPAAGGEDSR